MFVTFDGIEGCGKSTQLAMLSQTLDQCHIPHVRTREPGGSSGAELIRKMFIENEWDGVAESFLLMAARRDHVTKVIRPCLVRGEWCLCDRFTPTTLAYQGLGRGVSSFDLNMMNDLATDSLRPDLSIILDVPVGIALTRARARSTPDRMERLDDEWFKRVRQGFLELPHMLPCCYCVVIDGDGPPEEVHARVVSIVSHRLNVTLR